MRVTLNTLYLVLTISQGLSAVMHDFTQYYKSPAVQDGARI